MNNHNTNNNTYEKYDFNEKSFRLYELLMEYRALTLNLLTSEGQKKSSKINKQLLEFKKEISKVLSEINDELKFEAVIQKYISLNYQTQSYANPLTPEVGYELRGDFDEENNKTKKSVYNYFNPARLAHNSKNPAFGQSYLQGTDNIIEEKGNSSLNTSAKVYLYLNVKLQSNNVQKQFGMRNAKKALETAIKNFEVRITEEAQNPDNKEAQELFGFIALRKIYPEKTKSPNTQEEEKLTVAGSYDKFIEEFQRKQFNFYNVVNAFVKEIEINNVTKEVLKERFLSIDKSLKELNIFLNVLHKMNPAVFYQDHQKDVLELKLMMKFVNYLSDTKESRIRFDIKDPERRKTLSKTFFTFFKPLEGCDTKFDATLDTTEKRLETFASCLKTMVVDGLAKEDKEAAEAPKSISIFRRAKGSELLKFSDDAIEKINSEIKTSAVAKIYQDAQATKKSWVSNFLVRICEKIFSTKQNTLIKTL